MPQNDKTIPLPGQDTWVSGVEDAADLARREALAWSGSTVTAEDALNSLADTLNRIAALQLPAMNAPAVSPSVQEGMGELAKALRPFAKAIDQTKYAKHEKWDGRVVETVALPEDDFRRALDAITAYDDMLATSTPDRQKAESEQPVAPLVWESEYWNRHHAKNALLIVSIYRLGQERDAWNVKLSENLDLPSLGTHFDTLEEAKAFASEQYHKVMSQVTASCIPSAMLATAPQPPAPTAPASGEPVTLTYTNWRGETAERTITPTGRTVFEANEWHPEPQWLVEAHDERSKEVRLFALKGFGKAPASGGAAVAVEEVERLVEMYGSATFEEGLEQGADPETINPKWHDAATRAHDDVISAIRRFAAPQANDGVREAALEDAAAVCDAMRHPDFSAETEEWIAGTQDAASAIRALKADTKTTPGPVEAVDPFEIRAREIYESWKDQTGWVAWVERGNSDKQWEARMAARREALPVSQQIGEQAEPQGGL